MPPPPLPSRANPPRQPLRAGAVPCLILLGIIALVALYHGAAKAIRSHALYNIVLHGAMASPEVQAELGTPITSGNVIHGMSGELTLQGLADETLFIDIPLQGSKASGHLHYDATRSGKTWKVSDYSVVIDGSNKKIPIAHAAAIETGPLPPGAGPYLLK
jgi:hypothetical protein